MAYCIPKEKIDKLKNLIKGISDKNQLDTLVNLSPEKRIAFFERQLAKEEAILLNIEKKK